MEMGVGRGEIPKIPTPLGRNSMLKGKEVVSGRKNHDWDLNEWKWDSNLFVAERLNIGQSLDSCKELLPKDAENRTDFEKRRKLSVLEADESEQGDDLLTLKLGGDVFPFTEREGENSELKDAKRFKAQLGVPIPSLCQVDSCNANLSEERDYHRRHKVCEKHAKSGRVLLSGVLQRFCQQCSRFHLLQEFDEEKRSCRRRLAGHNRRRRKNAIVADHSLNDDQSSRYILICLLRILSNMHLKNSDQSKDHDILFQLLGMLSSPLGTPAPADLSRLIQSSQHLQNAETSTGVCAEGQPAFLSSYLRALTVPEPSRLPCSTGAASSIISCQDPIMATGNSRPVNVSREGKAQVSFLTKNSLDENMEFIPSQDSSAPCLRKDDSRRRSVAPCSSMPSLEADGGERTKSKLNDFDLNSTYTEYGDYKGLESPSQNNGKVQAGSTDFPSRLHQDIHQTSPTHMSGNSESTSDKSLSSSGEDVQCCTDRIIFKLFGKDPSDLPHVLRAQILNWISHSPTDIESYIRPGCIVLTIYLRLSKQAWEELCGNLTSSLKRLLEASDDGLWRTGWICAKVGHQLAFVYDGKVLLDVPLLGYQDTPFIICVTPVAVDLSSEAVFTVKGMHLKSVTKLFCSFQGQQSVHEISSIPQEENGSSADSFESFDGHSDKIQTLNFACSFANTSGRGFIEVELHDLSGGFLPFIVAEHDICSELRMLESFIDIVEPASSEMRLRDQGIEFLHEFGWLLERAHLVSGSDLAINHSTEFSNIRFKWLLEFSIERAWCAVVRKILNILFNSRGVDHSVEKLLNEVSPLHRAVRRNCRPLVEFLLKYIPEEKQASKANLDSKFCEKIFKSNMSGPAGITPLHIAASTEGAYDMLDLLTDEPEQDWIQTWEKGRDVSGFTPEDYAHQRGHDHYIQLVKRKISSKAAGAHLVLDMSNPLSTTRRVEEPPVLQGNSVQCKQKNASLDIDSRSTERVKCRVCEQLSACSRGHRVLNYRPAILSVVAIAAVCACVSLLLKTPPEVLFVVAFRWELLDYGYI
ncbi:squamosa promoter-binding-like protein 12 [Magnolia sinica]|uniref:squamosa promoter-binding-like protein 12 n=1 Tax=Magnolia sinica TaxID=86752 RepID=UPI0026594511|nr:squamosa promoter-binding-like protein 12 [Magnolia sinica]